MLSDHEKTPSLYISAFYYLSDIPNNREIGTFKKKAEFVSPLLNTLGQMDRKRQMESFPLCFWFCLDFIDVRIL